MKSDGEFYCKSWDACSGRVKAKTKVSLTINGEEPPTTTGTIGDIIATTLTTCSNPEQSYWDESERGEHIANARNTGMDRAAVLSAAGEAVNGSRDQDYGSPEQSFEKIAGLWNAYLDRHPNEPGYLEPWDVAAMLALLKVARIRRSPGHRDSWVDLAGYAACGAEAWANRQW